MNRLREVVRADCESIGCLSSWLVDPSTIGSHPSWLADSSWVADPTARIIDILNEVRDAMIRALVGAIGAQLLLMQNHSKALFRQEVNDANLWPYFLHDEVANTGVGPSASVPQLRVDLSLHVSTLARNQAVFCKDDLAPEGPMLLQMKPEPLQWETRLRPLHVSLNGMD